MDPDPNPFQPGFILLGLLILLTLLKITKTAVLHISESRLKELKQQGNKKAAKILKILEEDDFFTISADALSTMVTFALCFVAAWGFIPPFAAQFFDVSNRFNWVFIAFAALLFIIVSVTTDFISFYIGHQNHGQVALNFTWVASFCCVIMRPFVIILNFIATIFCRIFRIDTTINEENMVEEEIKQLMEEGEESGFIEDSEREMINNVFDFNDILAEQVMTHRTEMKALDIDNFTFEDIIQIATEDGFSRIPVYKEDTDHIEGVLYVKDLLKLLQIKSSKIHLEEFLREALFVPQTASCADLFELMSERKIQMAIVVDEYGGTAGVITMEDLLESIVGNIQDEYDDEELNIIKVDETTFIVEGSDYLDEICDELGIVFEEDNFNEIYTIGGFITEQIGHIPEPGEDVSVLFSDWIFKVEKVKDNRISKVRIAQNRAE